MNTPTLAQTLADYRQLVKGITQTDEAHYINGAMAMYILLTSAYDGLPCEQARRLLSTIREEMRAFFDVHGLLDHQEIMESAIRDASAKAKIKQGMN